MVFSAFGGLTGTETEKFEILEIRQTAICPIGILISSFDFRNCTVHQANGITLFEMLQNQSIYYEQRIDCFD